MKLLKKTSALFALLLIVGCSTHHTETSAHQHGHSHGDGYHVHTPQSGIVQPLYSNQSVVGFAEIKLHDDKGDLELWLTKDQAGKQPYDLPINTQITVSMPNLNKTVTLQVRNTTKNEDEDGKANIRQQQTNYFIFPGETGSDATFLMGKSFSTTARASFSANGEKHMTQPFRLYPHTH